jgi:hypothetical protein
MAEQACELPIGLALWRRTGPVPHDLPDSGVGVWMTPDMGRPGQTPGCCATRIGAHHPGPTMIDDTSTLSAIANNTFAAIVDPTASRAAHDRMSLHVLPSVIHRPMDDRQYRKVGMACTADFDTAVDAEVDGDSELGALPEVVKPGGWASNFSGHQSV